MYVNHVLILISVSRKRSSDVGADLQPKEPGPTRPQVGPETRLQRRMVELAQERQAAELQDELQYVRNPATKRRLTEAPERRNKRIHTSSDRPRPQTRRFFDPERDHFVRARPSTFNTQNNNVTQKPTTKTRATPVQQSHARLANETRVHQERVQANITEQKRKRLIQLERYWGLN